MAGKFVVHNDVIKERVIQYCRNQEFLLRD